MVNYQTQNLDTFPSRNKNALNILMNGKLVGILQKESQNTLSFIYHPSWLTSSYARPISLSLPLTGQSFLGDVVYNFFDNLLPDNQLIRGRIQAKFQIPTNHPFDLLATIGKDCVGAIQISDHVPKFKKEIHYETLNENEIASILRGYRNYPLGMIDDGSEFRISIAGAQEKCAFLYYKKKWCRPLKETPTSHIFKLPIGLIQHQALDLTDSCENEWLCSKIVEAFNLPVAKCEILHFENMKILAVERFDRMMSNDHTWLMRLPQEDLCQALGKSPNLKYQSDGGPGINEIMKLLLGSSQPIEDRDYFFSSQVLFWLLAAIDGHAKNFSVFIEPGGGYRLTPLYDIMSAYPLIDKQHLQKQKIKMAMALKGKHFYYNWDNIQRRHFLETAKSVNYSPERAEQILDSMLSQVDTVIEQVSATLPKNFPKNIAKSIFNGILYAKHKLNNE